MGALKILYVCHRFPFPPKRGGKIRPFNMIKHLSQRHQVTVASLARSAEEAQAGAGLAEHCERYLMATVREPWQSIRMVARLPTLTPSSMGYFYSVELDRQIQQALARERYDLIFVHCSSVAQYVSQVRDIPKILDFGDMDSQKWQIYARIKPLPSSLGYWLEGTKLEREEKRLARQFDLCTCTTKEELNTLNDYATGALTDWFPNGVDHEYFAPDATDYDPNRLSFIGRMDYFPNQQCMLEFCTQTLPLIRERRPDATLTIVGADPAPKIRALGDLPGVTVTGSVPDVRPYTQASAVMIAPLKIARGTQNKILEAMAMGVPVVTSSLAARGVDAEPGVHFLTADTPADYRDSILSLLDDQQQRQRFAQAARARVLSHHDWSASMQRLDTIIERCLDSHAQRSQQPVMDHKELA